MSFELRSIASQQNVATHDSGGVDGSDGEKFIAVQVGPHARAFGAESHRRTGAQEMLS